MKKLVKLIEKAKLEKVDMEILIERFLPLIRRLAHKLPYEYQDAEQDIHRIMPSSRLRQVAALGTPLSSRIKSTVQPPISISRTEGSSRRSSGCTARAEYPCGNSFTFSMVIR